MKNIVNPVPEIFDAALPQASRDNNGNITGWSPMPSGPIRRGAGYDYENERNKFVIDMIHTSVLGGYAHLNIGQQIIGSVTGYGLTNENRFLFLEDALAYAALYPQNAKVDLSPTAPPNPRNPRINGKSWALKFVGKKEQQDMLTVITNAINLQNSAFNTVTTEAAQSPVNQKSVNNPAGPQTSKAKYTVKEGDWLSKIAIRYGVTLEDILALDENAQFRQNPDLIEPGQVVTLPFNEANSRLPEIVPAYSANKVNQLVAAAGRPTGSIPSGLTIVKPDLAEEKRKVNPDIDFEDWTANVPTDSGQGSDQLSVVTGVPVSLSSYQNNSALKKAYYNPKEKNYWCVIRTLAKNPKSYDIAGGDEAAQNITDFKFDVAVPEILKFADRDNARNRAAVDPSKVQFLSKYGDTGRPQPVPEGQSFWTLAVKIPQDEVEKLTTQGGRSTSDDAPTVLKRAKDLLADSGNPRATGLRRAPYLVSDLRRILVTNSQIIEDYASKLDEEGITPSMMEGVNLRITAEDLRSFYGTIERFTEDNNITITVNDKIEFAFDSKYKLVNVFYNGRQYAGESDPKTGLITQFGATSKRTFALVFHAAAIDQLLESENRPPATEFVQKYIYPSPVIKPSDIKNKQEENKKQNKYPEENTGAGLGKNTFEVKPKKSKKKAKAKTKAEVEREFQRRFQVGNKALGFFTSTLNNAGCETPLAKYLNDAFLIYQLFGGKSSFRQIVGVVVKLLRDDIVELKKNEQLLLQGAGYLDDPDQIVRDIEREVNRQFFACFRVLGDILAKEVLEPGGVPPDVQQLVKRGLTPPRGVKLGKTPTGDLWALWRKQLLNLIIQFIKQLILQAFKQLLLAVAGCGPETVVDGQNLTRNRNRRVNSPYGAVRINDLVDYADIDLLEIARELQIQNTNAVTVDSEFQLVNTPATVEQLRQLNDDCSDLMVDVDVVAVLQGSGGQTLIDSLYRGINLGPLNTEDLSNVDQRRILNQEYDDELTRVLLNSVQESLYPGDTRYATLDFTKERIVAYFKRLGQLLGPGISLGLEKPLDTKEAYCDDRDILAYGLGAGLDVGLEDLAENEDGPIAGGLTRRQFRSQINQEIESTSFKIDLLCELAAKNFDFALEIQNFWDTIGFAEWFMDLLRFISEASRKAQGVQARAITAGMRAEGAAPTNAASALRAKGVEARYQLSQLYQFYNYYFGDTYSTLTVNDQVTRQGKNNQYVPVHSMRYVNGQVADIPGDHPHYKIGFSNTRQGKFPAGNVEDENQVPNVRSFGRLQLDYIPRSGGDQKVRVYFDRSERRVVSSGRPERPFRKGYDRGPSELICEFDLVNDNTPDGDGTYSVKNALSRASQILKTDNENQRRAQASRINAVHDNLMHISFGNILGNRTSKGGTGTSTVVRDFAESVFDGTNLTYESARQVSTPYLNSLYNITRTITLNFYANETRRVKERVDDTIELAAIPPFGPTGDPCNFGPDEQIALVTINAIHQRIFNFILNVAPLFNNGYSLGTPDTRNMLVAYLQNKIIRDLQERGIFGFVIQGMEFVTRTCSTREVDESGVEFNPALIQDPEEQLEYVIKQSLSKTFYLLSLEANENEEEETFRWGAMNRNLFEDINNQEIITPGFNKRNAYDFVTYYMQTGNGFSDTLPFANYRGGYLRTEGGLSGVGFSQDFETFRDREFLAAVPIPLLVGLQYIFYDKVVDITDKYPQMAFYARKRLDSADQSLRQLIDPSTSQNYDIGNPNQAQPKTLEQSKQEDTDLEKGLDAQVAQMNLIADVDEEVGEVAERAGQRAGIGLGPLQVVPEEEREEQPEQQQEQRQQQQPQPQPPRIFPIEIGGKTYNNLNDLRRDQAKYQSLIEKCNRIRSLKNSLETRLGIFGQQVARSEQLYKTTGTNFGGKSSGYKDFIRTGRGETAYRGKIHEVVTLVNRLSSLGITQYGSNQADGGLANQQRAYSSDRDLKVSNKDSITQADIRLSRQYHTTPPITREQAFGQRKLGYLEALIIEAMQSTWAGLKDSRETTAFYSSIIGAAGNFVGFSETPPARQLRSQGDYSIGNIRTRASRNNTVVGILSSITKEVADLDEAALFRDLGINNWDRNQRNRVESIITQMVDTVLRARGE